MSHGFITEVTASGAWLAAALVTLLFVGDIKELLLPYLKDPIPATIFATGGTFLISLSILTLIKLRVTEKYIRPHDVGVFDNIAGLGCGLVKGWLFATLGFLVLTLIKEGSEDQEPYPEGIKMAASLSALEHSVKLARGLPGYLPVPTTNFAEDQETENSE